MRRAQILIHLPREGAGRIAELLTRRGVALVEHALYDDAAVPSSVAADDVLVVMGGAMGVGDVGDPRWPFLADEIALLRRCAAEGRAVLGVCLGAQLLAAALGASVRPNTAADDPTHLMREVGWFSTRFHHTTGDPLLAGLPETATMLHWHGDTFALPHGGVQLASTAACAQQWFRHGRCIGLQFHPELDAATIAAWCDEDAEFACSAHGPGTPQRILAATPSVFAEYRRHGDTLLGNCLDLLLAP